VHSQLSASVNLAQANSVEIFGYGVGPNVDMNELTAIAGSDPNNVASETDYDKLSSQNNKILKFLNS